MFVKLSKVSNGNRFNISKNFKTQNVLNYSSSLF